VATVINGKFGKQAHKSGRAKYSAQEQEPGGKPDLDVPPDVDLPNFDKPNADPSEPPSSPPFTGEDVEDIPRRTPRGDHPVM
jgi:hypothetical protein